jgi:hypothetical protein
LPARNLASKIVADSLDAGVAFEKGVPTREDTMFNVRMLAVLFTAGALLAVHSAVPAADEAGFTKLFNGRDLTGFKVIMKGQVADPGQTFKVTDGAIVVSGRPAGYFVTEKGYKNYVLKFDWMYARPANLTDETKFAGNSGLLVHIQSTNHSGQDWPKCVEVQGMNRDHGKIFAIGGAKGTFTDKADVRKRVLKPVGQWNTTEVTSQDGNLCAKVNGEIVCEGKGELTEGPIGWQSEGAEIHFKNIMIKELK